MNKEFVKLRLSDIRPYPNNPRINDNAVKYVVQSIKDCENLDPIEVDEDNIILSGHTRLKALEQLGYDETECVRYTGLSEDQKKKYRILANKTGEFAEWDLDILSEELDSLLDFDAEFYDFELSFDDDGEDKKKQEEIREVEYRESISVVVACENDEQAENLFEKLTEEGYICRISTL